MIAFYQSKAQNLVPNPSFEQNLGCPTGVSLIELKIVKSWFQPTAGTADYFNECARNGQAGVPRNLSGFRYPHSGKAYIGLILYAPKGYREYFETKLLKPLVKGKRYRVQLYVSLAQISDHGISDIQVLFSPSEVESKRDKVLHKVPQLSYSKHMPVMDTIKWTNVEWDYTADGTEEYLTIGNFNTNKESTVTTISPGVKMYGSEGVAYYYIDDVCVAEVKADGTCDCNPPPKIKEISQEDTVIIQK